MLTNALSEIPVFRPDMTEAEIDAVAATMRSGWIGSGPRVAEFEVAFASAVGSRFAVSTVNGTAALQCAMVGLGVKPGDEVILPSFTWVSGFQALRALGATPVFADIEPDYLTIDPVDVEHLIGPRTKGILAVHHGGHLADIDALKALADAHGLWLLDDAAHACGAAWGARPVGSLGDATCFSFNAMKNLAAGDGGMVTTNDADLAQTVRRYRSLGIDRDTYMRYGHGNDSARWVYDVVSEGQRMHMNDIAAAIGLVQLQRLGDMNSRRAQLVSRYRQVIAELPALRAIEPRPGSRPSHHMFTVHVPQRESFIEAMRLRRISIGVHYIPVHLFSAAKPFHRSLPVTERLWPQVVTFPLYPGMTADEQQRVIAALRDIVPAL